jgi:hypothetical protein
MTDQARGRQNLTIEDDAQDDEVLASIRGVWGGPAGLEALDRQAERDQAQVDPVARVKERLRQGARERGNQSSTER